MENKKNYVDGIDVSACEHYRAEIETKMPYGEYEILKDKCHYSGIEVIQNCKGNKGCIYKQLKRLQAEIEKLKKLKAENERLKEENKELKKLKFKSDGIELLQDANLNLHNANVKYRQALQEIRDIILSPEIIDEETKKLHTSEELDNIVRWHREDKLSKIQAKINEVIGAE